MDEDRDETTASAPYVETDGSGTYCKQCGGGVETTDWYPIKMKRDTDGSLHIYEFCSETCKAAWIEEQSE